MIRAALKCFCFVLFTVFFMGTIALMHVLRLYDLRRTLMRYLCASVCWVVGVRLKVKGKVSPVRPLLLVTNHCSYIDIPLLGSVASVSFTPKQEIRAWPVIGFLGVLADCVFVDRRRSKVEEAKTVMRERLARGVLLCVFAEGTTNNGRTLKPFKSSFFSLSEEENVPVQPASIVYTGLDGKHVTREALDEIAWYREEDTFVPHFWRLLKHKRIDVELKFHDLLPVGERKAVCKEAEAVIAVDLKQRDELHYAVH